MVTKEETSTKQARRLQLEFSPEAYERLERMKENTDASSFAELMRNALRVYDWIKQQEKDGYELALLKNGVEVKSVKLLL